jgi:hypothetical protein
MPIGQAFSGVKKRGITREKRAFQGAYGAPP